MQRKLHRGYVNFNNTCSLLGHYNRPWLLWIVSLASGSILHTVRSLCQLRRNFQHPPSSRQWRRKPWRTSVFANVQSRDRRLENWGSVHYLPWSSPFWGYTATRQNLIPVLPMLIWNVTWSAYCKQWFTWIRISLYDELWTRLAFIPLLLVGVNEGRSMT